MEEEGERDQKEGKRRKKEGRQEGGGWATARGARAAGPRRGLGPPPAALSAPGLRGAAPPPGLRAQRPPRAPAPPPSSARSGPAAAAPFPARELPRETQSSPQHIDAPPPAPLLLRLPLRRHRPGIVPLSCGARR